MVGFDRDINVLIVDDDSGTVEILASQIAQLGYTVTTAGDGQEGRSTFINGDYQIVLTDLQMPMMDGIELLQAIKKVDPRTVVIVITGHGTIQSAVDAIKKGAYDYVTKPVSSKELELILSRAITWHRVNKQLGIFRALTIALLVLIPIWLAIGVAVARAFL